MTLIPFFALTTMFKRMGRKESDTTGVRLFNFFINTDIHLVEFYLLFSILLAIK